MEQIIELIRTTRLTMYDKLKLFDELEITSEWYHYADLCYYETKLKIPAKEFIEMFDLIDACDMFFESDGECVVASVQYKSLLMSAYKNDLISKPVKCENMFQWLVVDRIDGDFVGPDEIMRK
jgi:hypothetical protein